MYTILRTKLYFYRSLIDLDFFLAGCFCTLTGPLLPDYLLYKYKVMFCCVVLQVGIKGASI